MAPTEKAKENIRRGIAVLTAFRSAEDTHDTTFLSRTTVGFIDEPNDLARLIIGLAALSDLLLMELAAATGRPAEVVLNELAIHHG